jgi:hypothetical protein
MPTPQKIDLTPQELDLVLYAGDGVRLPLVVTDNDDPPNAVPLTGTVRAQIRIKHSDTTPAATFDVDMTDADTGNVILSLTGAHTQALVTSDKKFKGIWDVEWTPSGAQPRTLMQGKVECDPDATR